MERLKIVPRIRLKGLVPGVTTMLLATFACTVVDGKAVASTLTSVSWKSENGHLLRMPLGLGSLSTRLVLAPRVTFCVLKIKGRGTL